MAELRIGGAKDWGGDGLGKLGLTGPGVVGLRVGGTSADNAKVGAVRVSGTWVSKTKAGGGSASLRSADAAKVGWDQGCWLKCHPLI